MGVEACRGEEGGQSERELLEKENCAKRTVRYRRKIRKRKPIWGGGGGRHRQTNHQKMTGGLKAGEKTL